MSTLALVIGRYSFQYTASTKLDVWKIHNEALVKAIQANSQFSDVKVLTSTESYSIILEYSSSSKDKAVYKIEEVKEFAVIWGKRPEYQVNRYPDDPDNPGSYLHIVEDAVGGGLEVTTRYEWSLVDS